MSRPEWFERLLANDPYNQRRIAVLDSLHDAIFHLLHKPHRRDDVITCLREEVAAEMDISISSAVLERDSQYERLCRNLEVVLPTAIRILSKHNDRDTDEEVAADLISCIPTSLQQPVLWEAEVEDSESGQHDRRLVRR
ncbi:hypothetical protein N7489_006419 [Penicillium chrysogenum]|jgi:hypothetical protein|uniref:Uncharacterized protein n=1 Tax=Penicillium chrysogenum TaxID=5076 RepID=A0ABQ8W3K9_PENCH|nr:uncharacterized protein N7489_006419 [Penicillium chrysogenum]KAJ5236328.1 hypothetical protein N7489_006419 [Penicillium chrysogenum]KAJ5255232.1 hypothetical protein N7505_010383 [Penicillium chrysogenum]KAJ6152967.1 hypothetical protein N7497_007286 [Penicillium chrysogenum]